MPKIITAKEKEQNQWEKDALGKSREVSTGFQCSWPEAARNSLCLAAKLQACME